MTLATLFLCLTSVLTLGVPACLDFNEICKLFSLLLILLLHKNSPNIEHSHTYTNTHTLTRKLVFLYSCVVLLRFVFFCVCFPPVCINFPWYFRVCTTLRCCCYSLLACLHGGNECLRYCLLSAISSSVFVVVEIIGARSIIFFGVEYSFCWLTGLRCFHRASRRRR